MQYAFKPCYRCSRTLLIYQATLRSVATKVKTKSAPVFIRNVTSVEVIPHHSAKLDKLTPDKDQQLQLVEPEWQPVVTDWKNIHRYYMKLAKIRLTGLVVITTVAGYALAPAPLELSTLLWCSLGTALVSSAANAINQYHEVPFDAQMSRTKNRVLVRSIMTPLHALTFAVSSSALGLAVLYSGCNSLTAILGAGNLLLYTSVYTPLKRISISNTWIGSVVGAIPPVMGWVACTGSVDIGALILAGILYAWQFPHFNALSWNLRPDYSRAGYRMMAVTNPGLCRRTALRYTIAISALTFISPFCDITNIYFPILSLPLNSYFIYLAWKFYKQSDSANSRKLFKFSLVHLPVLMALMLLNKKHWFISSYGSGGAIDTENKSSIEIPPNMSASVNELLIPSTKINLNVPNVIISA